MSVNQLSVFLENRAGALNEFAACLKANDVNILALTIADTMEYGIARVVTNDNKKAFACLKQNGFNVTETDLIAVFVDDKPGAIGKVLDILSEAKIDVGYLYSYVRADGRAIILIKVDDLQGASELLRAKGTELLENLENK